MNYQNFYATISPELLQVYAELSGLGGNFPIDLEVIRKLLGENISGMSILEVGSGTGRLGIHLLDMCRYSGVETSEKYIDFFNNRAKLLQKPNPRIYRTSFMSLEEGQRFDVILFPWTVIGEFSDQIGVFLKSKSLLNKGGKVILDNPAKSTIYNTASGYQPKPFYYDEWNEKLKLLGFKTLCERYNTDNGRLREVIILELLD